jgi:hypothetical protein
VPQPLRGEEVPPFSVSPTSSALLESSLEHAVRRHDATMDRLHRAVDACVADLRDRGMTPEAVLVTMKALLRYTASLHPPPGYQASHWAAEVFVEQVVRWSIAAYFRLPDPPPGEARE